MAQPCKHMGESLSDTRVMTEGRLNERQTGVCYRLSSATNRSQRGKAMVRLPIGCVAVASRFLEARLGCQVERQTVLGRREHQKRHRYPQPPIEQTHVEAHII